MKTVVVNGREDLLVPQKRRTSSGSKFVTSAAISITSSWVDTELTTPGARHAALLGRALLYAVACRRVRNPRTSAASHATGDSFATQDHAHATSKKGGFKG
eukprot:2562190-Pleurochrysis_carterae.AAC.3